MAIKLFMIIKKEKRERKSYEIYEFKMCKRNTSKCDLRFAAVCAEKPKSETY